MTEGNGVTMTFIQHASEFTPGHITVNIETTLPLDADNLRANLRRVGGIRVTDVRRDGVQWIVTIAHNETNPHPLNARIWNVLEAAYDRP